MRDPRQVLENKAFERPGGRAGGRAPILCKMENACNPRLEHPGGRAGVAQSSRSMFFQGNLVTLIRMVA